MSIERIELTPQEEFIETMTNFLAGLEQLPAKNQFLILDALDEYISGRREDLGDRP